MPSAPLAIAWGPSAKSPDTVTAAASGARSRNVTVRSGRTSYDGGAGAVGPRPPRPPRAAAGGAWASTCVVPRAIEHATIKILCMGRFYGSQGRWQSTDTAKYHAIMGEVGTEDGLADSNRQLDQVLSDFGITHTFETDEGNHTNRVAERFETRVLPFLSKSLSSTRPKH